MAGGINALGNLLCRTDATGALVVGVDGSSALLFPLLAPDGSNVAPSYSFANYPTTGMYAATGPVLRFGINGTLEMQLSANTLSLTSATGTINSPNYTAPVGNLSITSATNSNIIINASGTAGVALRTGSTDRWVVNSSGHLTVGADNTYDIGVITTGRARNVYAVNFVGGGAGLTGIAGATGGISNTGNTNIVADSDNNGSGLIDFTTGITSKWQVVNAGHLTAAASTVQLQAADGAAATPSITFGSDTDTGLYWPSTGVTRFTCNGVNNAQFDGAGLTLFTSSLLRMGDGTDLVLAREAAGHWFQRNTTNAQRASWANTYTSTVNYESFSIDWQTSTNEALVGMRTAATGTTRPLRLISQATGGADNCALVNVSMTSPFVRLDAGTRALGAVNNNSTGNFFQVGGAVTSTVTAGTIGWLAVLPTYNQAAATTANTDLLINRTQTAVGSGTQRLFDAQVGGVSMFHVTNLGNVVAAGAIQADGGSTGDPYLGTPYVGWINRSLIRGDNDGILTLLNNAATDFSRLQFGGTTSSFPALKRSAAQIEVRLADDSAYTGLLASSLLATTGSFYFNVAGDVFVRRGTGTPEGAVVASVGALWLRTDGGANTTLYVKETGAGNTGWVAK